MPAGRSSAKVVTKAIGRHGRSEDARLICQLSEVVMSEFPAFAHVAVTVTDLERSTRWYNALFDAEPVLDEDEETGGFHHTVYVIGGGQLFGLHTHPEGARRQVQRAADRSGPRLVRVP